MSTYTTVATPLGSLLATAASAGVTGLYFPDHRRGPVVGADWREATAPFAVLIDQLAEYFDGARTSFDVPLELTGTAFQLEVWRALTSIPFGSTITYRHLACQLGRPRATRAVAGAIARNPVSIVIPCHRVVAADGGLGGYAGGIDRKQRLLALESHARVEAIQAPRDDRTPVG